MKRHQQEILRDLGEKIVRQMDSVAAEQQNIARQLTAIRAALAGRRWSGRSLKGALHVNLVNAVVNEMLLLAFRSSWPVSPLFALLHGAGPGGLICQQRARRRSGRMGAALAFVVYELSIRADVGQRALQTPLTLIPLAHTLSGRCA
jgi:hypothetical protein